MAVYTIADTHLSLGGSKPMDVFEGWKGYVSRLEENWRRVVKHEDTVVVAGDVSWAMRLENTLEDFRFLHGLPGKKILMKGNHDYWWNSMAKMNAFVRENGFDTLHFLFNNSYQAEGVWLCGTRGWMFLPEEPHDEKMTAREEGRLRASLAAAGDSEKIVFLHYPPLATNARAPGMIAILQQFGVSQCYYGHLHGHAIQWGVQGMVDGITYHLVSADATGFMPVLVNTPDI